MKYSGVCIMVEDMERAKRFYTQALSQQIVMDMEQNVTFDGGFSLQSEYDRLMGIPKTEVTQKSNSFELYFEEDNLDELVARLEAYGDVEFKHKMKEAPWGQYSIQFYDPDGHLIEVGETMNSLVGRFSKQGLTPEQISQRTSLPVPVVLDLLK